MRRIATVVPVAAAVTLTGCTRDSDTDKASTSGVTSASSSSSGTATAPADMLDFDVKPVATATSTSFLDNGKEARLSVASVRSTATGTVLTFWVTTGTAYASPLGSTEPESWPSLVDTAGRKAYGIDTFTNVADVVYCVCTDNNSVDPTRRVLTALYPALPDDLTSVSLRLKGFKTFTVPVTR